MGNQHTWQLMPLMNFTLRLSYIGSDLVIYHRQTIRAEVEQYKMNTNNKIKRIDSMKCRELFKNVAISRTSS